MGNFRPVFINAASGYHQEFSSNSDTLLVGSVTIGGSSLNAGGFTIQGVATPVNATDAATKAYVDAIGQGLSPKGSVIALAASNVSSLSGTTTIDGVSLTAGQRVLLTAQTTGSQNGIWVVQSGAWVRPSDFPSGGTASGDYLYIESGNTYAKQLWSCTNLPGSDTIDTASLTWTQIAGPGQYTAGNGIAISANTISVSTATSAGLTFTGGQLAVQINTSGGLQNTSGGVSILLNGTTLALAAAGLSVLGVPGNFTIGGASTNASVNAANLNVLTGGATSAADALHTHSSAAGAANQQATYANGSTALSAGDPVCWSSTADTMARAIPTADATSLVFGVAAAAIAANASGTIVSNGVVKSAFSGFTPNGQVWLAAGGGLTQTKPTALSTRIIRVGIAKNATDLWVQLIDQGKTGIA